MRVCFKGETYPNIREPQHWDIVEVAQGQYRLEATWWGPDGNVLTQATLYMTPEDIDKITKAKLQGRWG